MLLESSAGTFLVFVNCVDYIAPALTVIEVLVHPEAAAWLPLVVESHLDCHAPGVFPLASCASTLIQPPSECGSQTRDGPTFAGMLLEPAPALVLPKNKQPHSFRHLLTTGLQPVQCVHLGWHAPGVDPWWGCWNSWPACLPHRRPTWQASWISTCPSPPPWKTCSPGERRRALLQPPGCWPVRTDLVVFWCLWGCSWQTSVRLPAFGVLHIF